VGNQTTCVISNTRAPARGGALTQLYAHTYPDEVIGLVLVDSSPTELFERVPAWSKAIVQKLGLFRVLAPLSSVGLLALAPDSIPNRGFPGEGLARYRAVCVNTTCLIRPSSSRGILEAVRKYPDGHKRRQNDSSRNRR
jgi:pimeloyl-ACP methyl ester carboxylesterase